MILSALLAALASLTERGAPGLPGLESPHTLGAGILRLSGAWEWSGHDGLVVAASEDRRVTEVETWRLGALWGVGSWTDVGLDASYQIERGLSMPEIAGSGFGDTWIHARHQLPLDGVGGLMDLLVQGSLGLPTGRRGTGAWPTESFQQPADGHADAEGSTAQGGAGLSWGLDVAAGLELGTEVLPVELQVDAGVRGAEASRRDHQWRFGGGARWRMGRWASAGAGLLWRAPVHLASGDAWSALVVGLEVRPAPWWRVQVDLRQVLEAGEPRTWEGRSRAGGDSEVLRTAQVLPTVAAIRMAFDWQRPSPDGDGDGLADALDRCPAQREDRDGFEDADGCPDPDDDGDGACDAWIADGGFSERFAGRCRGRDACPAQREDRDGFEDTDGCSDPDNDRDGICDRLGMEGDASGCTGEDRCPLQTEDRDGFQDDDGCLDPDDDGDGVPDGRDACPHGRLEELPPGPDGCPLAPPAPVASPDSSASVQPFPRWILRFDPGSDSLDFRADSLLGSIRQVLVAWPDATVDLVGHTDRRGEAEYNQDLSERRARRVLEALVARGIEASRCRAAGRGFADPESLNFDELGRERNRRVEVSVRGRTP